jgi:hypothetical protein
MEFLLLDMFDNISFLQAAFRFGSVRLILTPSRWMELKKRQMGSSAFLLSAFLSGGSIHDGMVPTHFTFFGFFLVVGGILPRFFHGFLDLILVRF